MVIPSRVEFLGMKKTHLSSMALSKYPATPEHERPLQNEHCR